MHSCALLGSGSGVTLSGAPRPPAAPPQDTARNFLAGSSNSSDREKYALYMEATQLSAISYNLEVSNGQVRIMEEGVAKVSGAGGGGGAVPEGGGGGCAL